MEATEFSKELDKALALCRSAAELNLPIEAMIEHVEGCQDLLLDAGVDRASAEALDGELRRRLEELEALREILSAVAEVAAIGSKLPAAEPEPAELACPLPANLRRPR